MPQDGSNNYQYPPGTPGIPDTTIESEAYNTFLDDLVTNDLNIPRPIHRGGTGANNATTARTNLATEVAGAVVANYDTQVWENGSFASSAGAIGAPTATEHFMGVAVLLNPSGQYINLRVVGNATGKTYTRLKQGGVWQAWVADTDTINAKADKTYVDAQDALKLAKAGDTMTGNLTLIGTPAISLQKNAGSNNVIEGRLGASGTRWVMELGDSIAESGGNAGSNFAISRFSDAAAYLGTPISIVRSNGAVNIAQALTVGGNITAGLSGTTGTYYFGSSGTKFLTYDGTNFFLSGGILNASNISVNNGGVTVARSDGSYQHQLAYTGVRSWGLAVLASGSFAIDDITAGLNRLTIDTSGGVKAGNGVQGRTGSAGAYVPGLYNHEFRSGNTNLWVDTTDLGAISVSSDYRIKKDVIDLPGMWDTVKAMRPVKYTQAAFSPPSHLAYAAKAKAEGGEGVGVPLFPADDIERWGFIAHELQETLTPSAATGVKDAPDAIQSPNPFTLIAALCKALQEAMQRIEALEAQQTP